MIPFTVYLFDLGDFFLRGLHPTKKTQTFEGPPFTLAIKTLFNIN